MGFLVMAHASVQVPTGQVREVTEKVRPALVRIHVVSVDHASGREVKREAAGSGVIIHPEGYVITNHHVAGRARRLFCTLTNREEIEARLVGTDALSDIAVIQLLGEEGRVFPCAEFGDSDAMKVGDPVLAMGCPYALSQSVTMGIMSNTEMVLPQMIWRQRFTIDGEDVGSIVRWLGHDAPIYGGNSGGPLVNLEGKIIGINEMRMGLAGAIPGNLAQEVARELIEKGYVLRAWIGLQVQPRLDSQIDQQGVLVSAAIRGTPSHEAGFLSGDLLVELNGEPVDVRFAEELPLFNLQVASLPVGEKVKAKVIRQNETKTLTLKPEKRQPVRPDEREIKILGISCRDLTFLAMREMKRESVDGVLVTSLRPGGPCGQARPPLMPRDVIVEVRGEKVANTEVLNEILENIVSDSADPMQVLVKFERNHESLVTVVDVGSKEWNDPGLEARKAWIGVATQVITKEIAEQSDLQGVRGVRVTQVFEGTTAKEAGLQLGDWIVAIDGEAIPASEARDVEVFPTMVRQRSIGSKTELGVIREGKERTIQIELERSPKLAREMKRYKDEAFEFEVRDVAFDDRAREKWPEDLQGVIVETVEQGGWAALGYLSPGDLLLEINKEPIVHVNECKDRMDQIYRDEPDSVVFQVIRGIHRLYLEIKPAW